MTPANKSLKLHYFFLVVCVGYCGFSSAVLFEIGRYTHTQVHNLGSYKLLGILEAV